MAKKGRKQSLKKQLSIENITRIAKKAVRNAIKENQRLGIPTPVLDKNGKVIELPPDKALTYKG